MAPLSDKIIKDSWGGTTYECICVYIYTGIIHLYDIYIYIYTIIRVNVPRFWSTPPSVWCPRMYAPQYTRAWY